MKKFKKLFGQHGWMILNCMCGLMFALLLLALDEMPRNYSTPHGHAKPHREETSKIPQTKPAQGSGNNKIEAVVPVSVPKAGDAVTLTFTVVSVDGKPIPGASVTIRLASREIIRLYEQTAISNEVGVAEFNCKYFDDLVIYKVLIKAPNGVICSYEPISPEPKREKKIDSKTMKFVMKIPTQFHPIDIRIIAKNPQVIKESKISVTCSKKDTETGWWISCQPAEKELDPAWDICDYYSTSDPSDYIRVDRVPLDFPIWVYAEVEWPYVEVKQRVPPNDIPARSVTLILDKREEDKPFADVKYFIRLGPGPLDGVIASFFDISDAEKRVQIPDIEVFQDHASPKRLLKGKTYIISDTGVIGRWTPDTPTIVWQKLSVPQDAEDGIELILEQKPAAYLRVITQCSKEDYRESYPSWAVMSKDGDVKFFPTPTYAGISVLTEEEVKERDAYEDPFLTRYEVIPAGRHTIVVAPDDWFFRIAFGYPIIDEYLKFQPFYTEVDAPPYSRIDKRVSLPFKAKK